MFGQRPLPDGWLGQDAMLFYFQRRPHPEHKKSLGAYGACPLDERSLRALAEEIDIHADSRPFWTPDLSAFVIGFKRFVFNSRREDAARDLPPPHGRLGRHARFHLGGRL